MADNLGDDLLQSVGAIAAYTGMSPRRVFYRKHPVRTAAGLLAQYNLSGRLTGPDVELAPIPGQELI
jgi:hypothetical protein